MNHRQPKKRLHGALYRVSSGVLASAVIYLAGAVLAYAAADGKLSRFEALSGWLTGATEGAMETAEAAVETLPMLLGQNLLSAGLVFIGGVVLMLPGLWMLFKNGLVLGAFLQMAIRDGIGGTLLLTGLLPHGLFELAGLFLIGGTGLSTGLRLLCLRKKGRLISLRQDLLLLLCLSAGLLMMAAVIESFATPVLIDWIKNLS